MVCTIFIAHTVVFYEKYIFERKSKKMKTGINAWSIHSDADFEESFSKAHAAGFDAIELNIDKGGAHSLTLDTTDAKLDEIRGLSEKYSLPISSISTSLWGGNLGDGKSESIKFSEKLMSSQLKFAKKLGAKGILIVPGGMSSEISLKTARKNSLESLEALAPMVREYAKDGISVGVENVWNAFFTSPYDMASFIDELGRVYDAYFDLGNVIAFSRPEDWVEVLGNRIKFCHIKGFKLNGNINCGGTWCDISKSGLDWTRVRNALDKIGYDGFVTAEVSKMQADKSWEEYYRDVRTEIDNIIK